MHTPLALITLCACVLGLGACDKTPTVSASPMVDEPAPSEYGPTAGAVASPSVPSAESVFPPVGAAKPDPALGRSNGTLSEAQESTAMPLPGQNNDHSAPLDPARRASSP